MSVSVVYSRAQLGIHSPLVTVETHITNGLPRLSIVGLPEMAVKESKDRVRSAILNSAFEFPKARVTVNLAPADMPKEGGASTCPSLSGYSSPPTNCQATTSMVANFLPNWH